MTVAPPVVRRVLLLAHTGRDDAREVARSFVKALSSHDIKISFAGDQRERFRLASRATSSDHPRRSAPGISRSAKRYTDSPMRALALSSGVATCA